MADENQETAGTPANGSDIYQRSPNETNAYWLDQYQQGVQFWKAQVANRTVSRATALQQLQQYRQSLAARFPELDAVLPQSKAEDFGPEPGASGAQDMNRRAAASQGKRFQIQNTGYVQDTQTGVVYSDLRLMPPAIKAAYDAQEQPYDAPPPGPQQDPLTENPGTAPPAGPGGPGGGGAGGAGGAGSGGAPAPGIPIRGLSAIGNVANLNPLEADAYLGNLPNASGNLDDPSVSAFLNLNGMNTNNANPWLSTAASMVPDAALSAMLAMNAQNGIPKASAKDIAQQTSGTLGAGNLSGFDAGTTGKAFLNDMAGMQDAVAGGGNPGGLGRASLNEFLNNPTNAWDAMSVALKSGLSPTLASSLKGVYGQLHNRWLQQGNQDVPGAGTRNSQGFLKFLQGQGYFS